MELPKNTTGEEGSTLLDIKDEDLLTRVATGDENAMRGLYERHQAAVFAFAMARLGDRMAAADVLHDVMLDVWRQADRFQGRSAVRTWMLTMTRNKAIDAIRKTGRTDYGDDGETLVDDEPTPEAAVAASQDQERVRTCVSALPDRQKTAVHLTFFEGLSYPEAAEVEEVPVGTIKTRIFHAKKALAACLASAGVQSI